MCRAARRCSTSAVTSGPWWSRSTTPPLGTELHLRSETRPQLDIHTGVWRRGSGPDAVTAAVFAELVAGSYWVLDAAGEATQRVEIRGGALASIDRRKKGPIR